ncbi:MAG TPA: hypothetical protein VGE07_28170 [Herpetosiphonaceae bacterium]
MRHRSRIVLLSVVLAGCGVQESPAAPSAASGAPLLDGQPALTDTPTAALSPSPSAPPASPELSPYPPRREPPAGAELPPYPPRRDPLTPVTIYPTPDLSRGRDTSTPPTVFVLPSAALPADRVWIATQQLLSIGGDGSALSFELPPELRLYGETRRFDNLIARQGKPPVGVFTGGPEGMWHLADPASGATIELPIIGSSPPHGIAGADPDQLLLTDPEGSSNKLRMARVDLAAGTATYLEVAEQRIAWGDVVAWREPIAYVAAGNPGGDGPRQLWRVDLSQSPPTAAELFELHPLGRIEADQARGLLLARKAGAPNATLIDVATGAEEELPVPGGVFSPDGALIAALRPMAGADGKEELVVYDRAARTERVLAADLPADSHLPPLWFRSGSAVLLVPAGIGEGRGAVVTQFWLGGRQQRQLFVEGALQVAPLDDDHLLELRPNYLEAPALDGGQPAFARTPLASAGEIVYVP